MMRKEIYVNRKSNSDCIYFFRESDIAKLEYPPYTSYVASDRGVHESCKKRYSHDTEREIPRVRPRSYRRMCFEYFHHHSDRMKYCDNPDFFPRLQFCCYEKYLKEYCRNEEKIISIEYSLKRIIIFRDDNHEHEKEPKNTSIGLSIDKYEEVMEIGIHILYSVLFDKKKYHFSEGLYRYSHKK